MTTPGRRSKPVQMADAFAPSGFADSEPSRYVGGTLSGPPTTGVYEAADFVIAADGFLWICITSGEPGTWRGVQATVVP